MKERSEQGADEGGSGRGRMREAVGSEMTRQRISELKMWECTRYCHLRRRAVHRKRVHIRKEEGCNLVGGQ